MEEKREKCSHICNVNPESLPMEMLEELSKLSAKEHKTKNKAILILIFILFASNMLWSYFLFRSQQSNTVTAYESSNTIINDGDIQIDSDK